MLCRWSYRNGILQTFMNGSPGSSFNIGVYPLSRTSSFTIDYISSQYVDNVTWNFHGYISELIVFGRGLKDDEVVDIEKYLARKYAIKLTY